jgi:hypothetical protein
MKMATFSLWNAFLMLCVIGHAGTIPPDPEMEIDTGSLSTPVGTIFTFFSNANGAVDFQNVSGAFWFRLDVSVPFSLLPDKNLSDYHCHAGDVGSVEAFATCSIIVDSQNKLVVTFQGVSPPLTPPVNTFDTTVLQLCCEGIPDQGHFIVGLGDTGWGPNQQFLAQANVPEPGSIFLFTPALLGVLWAKRRRSRARNRRSAGLNSSFGRTW